MPNCKVYFTHYFAGNAPLLRPIFEFDPEINWLVREAGPSCDCKALRHGGTGSPAHLSTTRAIRRCVRGATVDLERRRGRGKKTEPTRSREQGTKASRFLRRNSFRRPAGCTIQKWQGHLNRPCLLRSH